MWRGRYIDLHGDRTTNWDTTTNKHIQSRWVITIHQPDFFSHLLEIVALEWRTGSAHTRVGPCRPPKSPGDASGLVAPLINYTVAASVASISMWKTTISRSFSEWEILFVGLPRVNRLTCSRDTFIEIWRSAIATSSPNARIAAQGSINSWFSTNGNFWGTKPKSPYVYIYIHT